MGALGVLGEFSNFLLIKPIGCKWVYNTNMDPDGTLR